MSAHKPKTQHVGTLAVDGFSVAIHRAIKPGHRNVLVLIPGDDRQIRVISEWRTGDGCLHIEFEADK